LPLRVQQRSQGRDAMPIKPFLKQEAVEAVFGPAEIQAMSMALNDVCKALQLDGNAKAKEIIAIRIIKLARRGGRSRTELRARVLAEANGGTAC
jgi:hypothetical protein